MFQGLSESWLFPCKLRRALEKSPQNARTLSQAAAFFKKANHDDAGARDVFEKALSNIKSVNDRYEVIYVIILLSVGFRCQNLRDLFSRGLGSLADMLNALFLLFGDTKIVIVVVVCITA